MHRIQNYKSKFKHLFNSAVLSSMIGYHPNQPQQDSHHSFDIKPLQPDHPIYMTSPSAERQSSGQKISQSMDIKHIGILVLGKALVITLYFVLSDFKLLDFVFVTLLVSVDFWVNKNLHGKQLAGLRWWVEINQNSEQEEWVFESADPLIEINHVNNAFFWITNLTTAVFWFINFIIIIIITNSLFWIGLCLFCFGITFINLACFYKCRGQHQKKLQQIIEKVGLKSAASLMNGAENMNDQSHHESKFQIQ